MEDCVADGADVEGGGRSGLGQGAPLAAAAGPRQPFRWTYNDALIWQDDLNRSPP